MILPRTISRLWHLKAVCHWITDLNNWFLNQYFRSVCSSLRADALTMIRWDWNCVGYCQELRAFVFSWRTWNNGHCLVYSRHWEGTSEQLDWLPVPNLPSLGWNRTWTVQHSGSMVVSNPRVRLRIRRNLCNWAMWCTLITFKLKSNFTTRGLSCHGHQTSDLIG